MITQRPELRFQNVSIDRDHHVISFDVVQQVTGKRSSGRIHVRQTPILKSVNGQYEIEVGSFERDKKFEEAPYSDVDGIKFYGSQGEFLHWLTPEKLFRQFSHGMPGVEGLDGFRDLMCYKVLYIGKATDEDMWTRLTGHKKLQEILSVEYPLSYQSLPTHEIVLLLFMVEETLDIIGLRSVEEIKPSLLKKHRKPPDAKKISTDAEKAFVHLLNPVYNIVKYSAYPRSSDGLFSENYDSFAYAIREELAIECRGQRISGSLDDEKSDTILIKASEKVILIQSARV